MEDFFQVLVIENLDLRNQQKAWIRIRILLYFTGQTGSSDVQFYIYTDQDTLDQV